MKMLWAGKKLQKTVIKTKEEEKKEAQNEKEKTTKTQLKCSYCSGHASDQNLDYQFRSYFGHTKLHTEKLCVYNIYIYIYLSDPRTQHVKRSF
jgi:hypothetical protein